MRTLRRAILLALVAFWVAVLLLVRATSATPRSAPVQPALSRPVQSGCAERSPLVEHDGDCPESLGLIASGSLALARGFDSRRSASSPLTPPAISHGIASWFDAKGYQGAVPWWKAGQQPVWATLSRFADGKTYSVTLLITGFCQCLVGTPGERLIDLSDDAFRQLAPLSVGLIKVQMTVPVQGPRLPATDTAR